MLSLFLLVALSKKCHRRVVDPTAQGKYEPKTVPSSMPEYEPSPLQMPSSQHNSIPAIQEIAPKESSYPEPDNQNAYNYGPATVSNSPASEPEVSQYNSPASMPEPEVSQYNSPASMPEPSVTQATYTVSPTSTYTLESASPTLENQKGYAYNPGYQETQPGYSPYTPQHNSNYSSSPNNSSYGSLPANSSYSPSPTNSSYGYGQPSNGYGNSNSYSVTGGPKASSIDQLQKATGIYPLTEILDLSNQISNASQSNSQSLAKNKATVLAALNQQGASQREIAIAISMAMQETDHMSYSEGDHSKSGASANYGLFNLNADLINQIQPNYSPSILNSDSDSATSASVALVLKGLRKSDQGWYPINTMLNYVRGGAPGYKSTMKSTDCQSDCKGYRNSIAAMTYLILNPAYTNKILVGNARINSSVKYV